MKMILVDAAAHQLVAQIMRALNDGDGKAIIEILDKGETIEVGPVGALFRCEGLKIE